ncbi:M15 family metallopeptidase [Mycobacterium sp. ITM-2016-00317]|uniref:M15 family metallopeptidase n=1 Tax=Mycobacterium sp. ITM-2016-00317 TaxID=2099694 RepID=UPI000D498F63|nr:M15 family metallopeptidase [Mycobacterium sp. ITM-2016-00317]WNG88599.1 M15 family metallopeptidase [Mycobacterium sp. ITM-2016-00317]
MRCAGLAALAVATAVLVQCAPADDAPTPSVQASSTPSPAAAPLPAETVRTVTPAAPRPRPAEVHTVTAADLGTTWRPGCPLEPKELRRIELDHWGFDGQTHRGRLMVHRELTDEVIEVFAELHRLRYPIEKMDTADRYPGADDELSMRDNNTSAFNCRDIPGTGNWSLHAYGRAVDVNPRLNPYIDRRGDFQPANAGPWVDRTRTDAGMLHDGDPAVRAFTDRGWRWGGHWRTPFDYQHFEIG